MKKLYVIGNGFDIAHDIDCGYWDFRTYLRNNAEEFLLDLERIYGVYPLNDEHIISEDALQKATKAWEKAIYENLWKTFEDKLGHPDENDIESTCSAAIEAMSDIEFGGIEDTLNQYFESQFQFIKELQNHLFDWVKQIGLDKAKKVKEGFSDMDLYLTFNYTPVLERVYGINKAQICHIHGGIPPYCSEPPVIGHGNKAAILKRQKWQKECEEIFDEGGASMNRAFANFYKRTLKDTDYYMFRNNGFFRRAQSVDEVHVIGHSLGEVDLPYFKALPINVPWKVYYHSKDDKEPFEGTIKSIGVKCLEMKSSEEFWTK